MSFQKFHTTQVTAGAGSYSQALLAGRDALSRGPDRGGARRRTARARRRRGPGPPGVREHPPASRRGGRRPLPRREAHELHYRQGVPQSGVCGDRGILRPPCAGEHGRDRGRAGFRGFSRGNRRHGLYSRGLRRKGVLRNAPQKGRIGTHTDKFVSSP